MHEINQVISTEFPFAAAMQIPRTMLKLGDLPDFQLRVKHAETGEIRSEFFRGKATVKEADVRALDMKEVEQLYMLWLKKRFGEEWLPADFSSWSKMAGAVMLPYFFESRMKHLRPDRYRHSMLESNYKSINDNGAGPRLRLILDKNLTMQSTFYHGEYFAKHGGLDARDSFEGTYDSHLQYGGAVGGWLEVFDSRQIFVVQHRFIHLNDVFDYAELKHWVQNRVEALMPGIVLKGLIWNFQWLEQGKYFGGDEPHALTARAAQQLGQMLGLNKAAQEDA